MTIDPGLTITMAKRIELWPVDRLKPYERNARTHSTEQVAQIAASIVEFGFTNPILVDSNDGIIAGHGRLTAAQELGLKTVPVVVLDHLSERQRKAYIIADNQLALNAGWDTDLLRSELQDLAEQDFDLSLIGFSDEELADLLPDVEELPPEDADPDDVPEVPEEPITKPGDLWILGDHRLLCGDSTDVLAVERLMDGQKADMVFTDPPYALFGNSTGVAGISDDKMIMPFFRDIFSACRIHVKAFGHIYSCCDWHSCNAINRAASEVTLPAKNLIVWDKGDAGLGGMFMNCHELIWFFTNTPENRNTTKSAGKVGERPVNGVANIWRIKKVPPKQRSHNAAKPTELVNIGINASSDKGHIVLDLFGGSGTTLISAEETGRRCRVMEMEPKYCDVIVKRWQQFTGKTATLEATGEPFPGDA